MIYRVRRQFFEMSFKECKILNKHSIWKQRKLSLIHSYEFATVTDLEHTSVEEQIQANVDTQNMITAIGKSIDANSQEDWSPRNKKNSFFVVFRLNLKFKGGFRWKHKYRNVWLKSIYSTRKNGANDHWDVLE